ncbi:DUF4876 domain-containing protein [Porphyromonadaceae bacterium W3.11]|nr:DUF4876 domain-containing protein [Porphyromonadaceae bacterium W3.11]
MNKNLKNGLLLVVITMLALTGCKKGEAPIGGGANHGGQSEKKDVPQPPKELDHLIFEEIFYVGTYQEKYKVGRMTEADHYIKINNPTKETIYLDGLALVEGAFNPTNPLNIPKEEDHIKTHIATSKLIKFPGSGKEYPLEPGKSVVLANAAINTIEANEGEGSLDLTNADFEIYTPKQIEDDLWLEENPKVPNMEMIYYDVQGFDLYEPLGFSMAKGHGVIALVKLGVTIEELKNESYIWDYRFSTSSQGGHSHSTQQQCLKIPNEWVIDAVVLCPNGANKWAVVDPKIDAGSNGVMYANDVEESYSQKALIRKHNGKSYEDTDNSTVDFEIKQASLLKK